MNNAKVKYIEKSRRYEVKFNLSAEETIALYMALAATLDHPGGKYATQQALLVAALSGGLEGLGDKYNIDSLLNPSSNGSV